ncbi:AraC family transcriptional regulator [Paenibacillus sp. 598K]|uniref:helix-turn-helix domain-containing protein n=1 Tax=Paenibacillus sp. 598K TaxID=1117987 RepID=UPI000FFAF464|nr:helix-turn-helix domain-containing protein [Paenibacillus sp. 598K]GBF76505.1 AraC family transcriptional regulator [Paenibacillus sp. 598K]
MGLVRKFKAKYTSRLHLRKMMILISILTLLSLSTFAIVFYFVSQEKIVQQQVQSNTKVLQQVRYNITYMNEIIKNMAISTFFDEELTPLMSTRTEDILDMLPRMMKQKKRVDSTSFLHSIVVYNGKTQSFYANNLKYALDSVSNQDTDKLLANFLPILNKEVPWDKMKLLPMSTTSLLTDERPNYDIFTLAMYQSLDNYSIGESVLFINVKSEWLLNNLKMLNQLDGQSSNGDFFVVDREGTVLLPSHFDRLDRLDLGRYLQAEQSNRMETLNTSYFTATLNGAKQIVTIMDADVNNWQIVMVQPYKSVMETLYQIRNTLIMVTLCFLVIAAILAVMVSLRLYRPIDHLMLQVGGDSPSESTAPSAKDEVSYVIQVYQSMKEKLAVLKSDQTSKRNIVKEYYIQKLLKESDSIAREEFRQCIADNGIHIHPDGRYLIAVLTIDENSVRQMDAQLSAFALMNIVEETFFRHFLCECIDMRTGHLVLLISTADKTEQTMDTIGLLLREVKKTVASYYNMKFGVAISVPCEDYTELSERYLELQEVAMYRIIFGLDSIIVPEMTFDNRMNAEVGISLELEQKLVESIKLNNEDKVRLSLDGIFSQLSKLSYNHMMTSLFHLILVVRKTITEMNTYKLQPITLSLNVLHQSVSGHKTLEDIKDDFLRIFGELSEEILDSGRNKNTVLISKIKEIIEDNYKDENLSLQAISSMLKMSSAYVGRVFKASEAVSVGDYINEVRMKQAIKLMDNERYTIKDIMEIVGYSNLSYFWRLFKKKFGTTPKEYRQKKAR